MYFIGYVTFTFARFVYLIFLSSSVVFLFSKPRFTFAVRHQPESLPLTFSCFPWDTCFCVVEHPRLYIKRLGKYSIQFLLWHHIFAHIIQCPQANAPRWYLKVVHDRFKYLMSSAAITLCVASQRVIPKVSVYFVMDSVRNFLVTPSYLW
jgi:hypothetical protein